jgi:hypothetical protein
MRKMVLFFLSPLIFLACGSSVKNHDETHRQISLLTREISFHENQRPLPFKKLSALYEKRGELFKTLGFKPRSEEDFRISLEWSERSKAPEQDTALWLKEVHERQEQGIQDYYRYEEARRIHPDEDRWLSIEKERRSLSGKER